MSRPTQDEHFLQIALVTSLRATCARRKVGAVAVDANGYVLSTGYNGLPKGMTHCTDKPCAGAGHSSGSALDVCQSIHAEINMIAHCQNPQNIRIVYLTCTPCMSCMKAIIATGCRWIIASEIYDEEAILLFGQCGGNINIIETPKINSD